MIYEKPKGPSTLKVSLCRGRGIFHRKPVLKVLRRQGKWAQVWYRPHHFASIAFKGWAQGSSLENLAYCTCRRR